MNKQWNWKTVLQHEQAIVWTQIVLGCIIGGAAYPLFLTPCNIAPGGLTGVGMILNYLFQFPIGTTALVLNIPLFIMGYRSMGHVFVVRSLVATVLFSLAIDILQLQPLTSDPKHGTKGLLGIGAKPAIVELTEKPAEEVVVPDFTAELARERRERTERRGNRDNRSGRDNRENRDNRRREDRETVTAIAEGVEETRKEIIEPEIPETDMPVGTGTAAAEAYDENAKYDVPETVNRAEDEFAAKPERNEKYERNNRANRDSRGNRSRPQRQNREEEPAPEAVKEPPVNYTEEAAEGEPAAQFVTELIEKMGIGGKVLAAREEDAIRLRIDSDTMGVLIGHRGETLDAIQYLTGLVINRNRKVDGYTRVTINTEDYREKREETLIRLARRVAAQVKSTGRPRTLEAMNPYERRILHSALQNNPYVTTHSEGEEPNRRVVVAPKRGRRPQRPRDKA